MIRLQCDFITGSNALGRMVILVGEFNNITVNLTKENEETSTTKILSLNESFKLCYYSTGMVAYDIESDGTVGTLAVPGHLEKSDLEALCNGLHFTTKMSSYSYCYKFIHIAGSKSLISRSIFFALMVVLLILIP